MNRKVIWSNQFKKDYKLAIKRGLDIRKLDAVISALAREESLPSFYKDHELQGSFKGLRECHIAPNWLLIYHLTNDGLYLVLFRTGSHSDLFK